jgi:hypothetical protein
MTATTFSFAFAFGHKFKGIMTAFKHVELNVAFWFKGKIPGGYYVTRAVFFVLKIALATAVAAAIGMAVIAVAGVKFVALMLSYWEPEKDETSVTSPYYPYDYEKVLTLERQQGEDI